MKLWPLALIHIRHWWLGCRLYNVKWPSWEKHEYDRWGRECKYPTCGICGGQGWWIWGWKSWPPDHVAQKIWGRPADETSAYWAKHDGWKDP